MRRGGLWAVLAVVAIVVLGWPSLTRTAWSTTTTTTPTTTASNTTASTTTSLASAAKPAPVCVHSTSGFACHPWKLKDPWSKGNSIYTNSFLVGPLQPGVTAYAAWIRSSTSELALYPGYEGPGPTSLSRGPEQVPPSARVRLLATFNAGFYEADARAGFYVNHTLYYPMLAGLATVVRYRSGRVDVIAWHGGARPPANVLMARQNLSLLVSNARPTPGSAVNSQWGLTLHGVAAVWRTALGVDAQGNLIYVAAPNQTAASLASLMLSVHAVRAMELDINPEWPIFVTYGAPGALGATLFVPNPNQVPNRFLYTSTKDFFAVFASQRPGEAQPW